MFLCHLSSFFIHTYVFPPIFLLVSHSWQLSPLLKHNSSCILKRDQFLNEENYFFPSHFMATEVLANFNGSKRNTCCLHDISQYQINCNNFFFAVRKQQQQQKVYLNEMTSCLSFVTACSCFWSCHKRCLVNIFHD